MESGFGRCASSVCFAHGLAKLANLVGVLDAARRLDARAHVNGPGPDGLYPSNDVSGMQPTRQNDRMGHGGRNERPIKDLSTAAETLDVGVEEDGLGVRMLVRRV